MENQTEIAAPSQSKKGMAALAVAAAVLFVVALGLGLLYFFKMEEVNDLQRRVDELKTAAAKMDKEMAQEMHAMPAVPTVKYREIPELGVKYKVTDQVKDLTYSVRSYEDDMIRDVDFSTIAMSGMQDDSKELPCVSSNAPSGMIARYVNGDRMLLGKTVKEVGKKVGEYYYIHSYPQYACEVKGAEVPGLQASIDAVKAAFDSLEVM